MDPVEKTFDTVYYLGQRAQSTLSGAVGAVNNTAASISTKVGSTFDSLKGQAYTQSSSQTIQSHGFLDLNGVSSFYHKNKKLASVLGVSSLVISGYLLQRLVGSSGASGKIKRRAERLPNGARKDVVLIVGSVTEPLTRYIANDLENRGFIVYITSTNSKADLKFFNNESVQDIKSLIVSSEPASDEFNAEQIRKFD